MCQLTKDPETGELNKRTEACLRMYPKEKEAFDAKRESLRVKLGKRVSQSLLMEVLIDIAYEAKLGSHWLTQV